MEEEIGSQRDRRPKRQLVYPFLEIDYRKENDGREQNGRGTNMVEVVEIAKDGRLVSIKEVSEIFDPENPRNPEE
jgi:hypothetical protein